MQGMRGVSQSGEAAEAAAAAVTAALPLLRRLAGRGGPLEATRRPDPGRASDTARIGLGAGKRRKIGTTLASCQ